MSSTVIAEPLLVTREQLDSAIAIVRETAAEFGIDPTIEADIYVDPEIASEPPVQLLTIHILTEPAGGVESVDRMAVATWRALRAAGLYKPQIPLETSDSPEW